MKKQETDAYLLDDDSRPILSAGIGRRIGELVEAHGAKKRMSDTTGISLAQLDRYIKEKGAPTIEPLARIAAAAGVCLEWLALGNGPKWLVEREAQRFDVETLGQAVKVLETRLKTSNSAMGADAKAEMIANIYQLLIDEGGDEKGRANLILKLLSLDN